jgi:hypothetical protein
MTGIVRQKREKEKGERKGRKKREKEKGERKGRKKREKEKGERNLKMLGVLEEFHTCMACTRSKFAVHVDLVSWSVF